MIRKTLQMVAGGVLVIGAFWNFHLVDSAITGLPSREAEPVVFMENQYRPVEFVMTKEQPAPKRIGYISAGTLRGEPLDGKTALRFSQLRYVMIPRILVTGADEPYVLGDFRKGDPVPQVPANLIMIYDSGNGMILYKQKLAR